MSSDRMAELVELMGRTFERFQRNEVYEGAMSNASSSSFDTEPIQPDEIEGATSPVHDPSAIPAPGLEVPTGANSAEYLSHLQAHMQQDLDSAFLANGIPLIQISIAEERMPLSPSSSETSSESDHSVIIYENDDGGYDYTTYRRRPRLPDWMTVLSPIIYDIPYLDSVLRHHVDVRDRWLLHEYVMALYGATQLTIQATQERPSRRSVASVLFHANAMGHIGDRVLWITGLAPYAGLRASGSPGMRRTLANIEEAANKAEEVEDALTNRDDPHIASTVSSMLDEIYMRLLKTGVDEGVATNLLDRGQ